MRHVRTSLGTATLAVLLAMPELAAAQYREGEPPTLQAPPPAADPANGAIARFRRAYASAASPRVVIFWNRIFDDEVASTYRERVTADGRVAEERVTQKRQGLVSEPVEWEVERAFSRTLAAAGVRLVDRSSAMRMQGLQDNAQERANVQAIESRAVIGKAELMIEVLQTTDTRAKDGISFRITAKNVRSAEIVADVLSTGRPPARAMPLVPSRGPGGFERARPAEPGPGDIGRQLAIELLDQLARGLR